jgi:serine protease Do
VGVNTAIYSRSGGSQGIGFAIPANMVARVLDSALKGRKVVRPWLGAGGQPVTSDLAASLGLERPVGVIVSEVYPGGPSERAGLRVGDVVLAINGHEVDDPRALRFRIASLPEGGTATLTVRRGSETVSLTLPLRPPPDKPPRDTTTIKGRNPLAGAAVANLSPALAEELQMDTLKRSVIVLGVQRRSPAAQLGIQPGDMVAKVNGNDIDSVATLRRVMGAGARRWTIAIRRDDRLLSVTIDG